MIKLCLGLFGIFVLFSCKSEFDKLYDMSGLRRPVVIRVDNGDFHKFEVVGKEIKPVDKKTYTWFENSVVNLTEGYAGYDLLDGKYRIFSKNGKLLELRDYNLGVQEGEEITYFLNGNIESRTNFKNGVKSGFYKIFYENGFLREEGKYKDGRKIKVKSFEYSAEKDRMTRKRARKRELKFSWFQKDSLQLKNDSDTLITY